MMRDPAFHLSDDFTLEQGASDECLQQLKSFANFPDEYCSFLKRSNGGEGFVGEEYLILWKAEEIEQFNREYEVEIYAPGLLLFGSNGGGEGFGFDTRDVSCKVAQVPFIGMDLQHASVVADSFFEFLKKMKQSNGSLL